MTTATTHTPAAGTGGPGSRRPDSRFGHAIGLSCRECGATCELGAHYACADCFGPLEVRYPTRT